MAGAAGARFPGAGGLSASSSLQVLERQVLLAVGFGGGFVAAYLSTILLAQLTSLPANVWIGGRGGLLLRPEPILIPLAVPFGLPAVLGTAVGVLLHNVLFRLGPGGVTLPFAVAQTLVVLVGGALATLPYRRLPRPMNTLAVTWLLSTLLVLPLGVVAAVEYATPVTEEWFHIFQEVLLPVNVIGLALLEVWAWRRGGRPAGTEAGDG